jgi:hypothetical protein
MDLIVDLIDQLIEERIKKSRLEYAILGKDDTDAAIIKEKIRRILIENIPTK